jgi:hypothetical protein
VEFHLYYRGRLKANSTVADKQTIRQQFHGQLKNLWDQKPLTDFQDFLLRTEYRRNVGKFAFVPLVNETAALIAELDILFLRPEAPGSIITQGGDIDNRLKTLFDALRMPKTQAEFPKNWAPAKGEDPFFVLLEDDNLIQHVAVRTDRLLDAVSDQLEVVLIIRVKAKLTRATMENIGLGF